MEKWYSFEQYQPLSEADKLAIEACYDKIYALMDKIMEIYEEIERIVESDQARREQLFFS